MMMNRTELKRSVKALGWPGLLGLLALALATALAFSAQRWTTQAAQLQAEADGLNSQLRSLRAAGLLNGPAAAPATPQQWQQALPSAEARQQRLADLLEIGLRMGMVSARTEHRLTVDAGAGLERLRVSMPLTGGYAQLRAFIDAALRHDPALSLDALKLRRSNPNAAELEAELVWSLHGRIDQRGLGAQP
jgi:Tfp pilus assembly protein PilO